MKSFSRKTLLAALGLALVPLATSASAQTFLKFNAPFAFAAGSQVLPPGQYNLAVDAGRMQVTIISTATTATAMVHLGQGGAMRPLANAKDGMVRFEKWGDQYFLVGIFAPGSRNGDNIVPSRKLVEFAKAEVGPEATPAYIELR